MRPFWLQVAGKLGQVGTKLGQVRPRWPKLAPSWGQVGSSWGQVEPSWGHVGPSWAKLGLSWAQVGAKLEPRCGQVGSSWLQNAIGKVIESNFSKKLKNRQNCNMYHTFGGFGASRCSLNVIKCGGLGASWLLVGGSWRHFWSKLQCLGPTWLQVGGIEAILAQS